MQTFEPTLGCRFNIFSPPSFSRLNCDSFRASSAFKSTIWEKAISIRLHHWKINSSGEMWNTWHLPKLHSRRKLVWPPYYFWKRVRCPINSCGGLNKVNTSCNIIRWPTLRKETRSRGKRHMPSALLPPWSVMCFCLVQKAEWRGSYGHQNLTLGHWGIFELTPKEWSSYRSLQVISDMRIICNEALDFNVLMSISNW